MASAKLTTERKEELKKYILEEIEKNDSTAGSKSRKKTRSAPISKKPPTEKKPALSRVNSRTLKTASVDQPKSKVKSAPRIKTINQTQTEVLADQAPNKQPRQGWAGLFVRLLVFILLTLLLLLVIDIFGLYRLGWTDDFSYRVAQFLRLPAGQAGDITISAADYIDDVQIIKSALVTNREGFNAEILQDVSEIEDKIFNRLAMIALIEKELEKNNRSITVEQLDQEMAKIIDQVGGLEAAENTTQELYQMSLNDFRRKVLRPLMAKDVLQEIIVANEDLAINQQAKERAQVALNLALDKTVDFAVLAEQYTEDEAGINTGGDLGWISNGELSAEMESAVLGLDKGEVYPELIKNHFGYHIVKATDRAIDPDTGQTSVKVSHILIKVDVNEYIKQLMDNLKIKNYLKSN